MIFKRTFRGAEGIVEFTTGIPTPVGFAIFDGEERDVGGRKAVSTWYYIVPEKS